MLEISGGFPPLFGGDTITFSAPIEQLAGGATVDGITVLMGVVPLVTSGQALFSVH